MTIDDDTRGDAASDRIIFFDKLYTRRHSYVKTTKMVGFREGNYDFCGAF